jgi:hypothetical protein
MAINKVVAGARAVSAVDEEDEDGADVDGDKASPGNHGSLKNR